MLLSMERRSTPLSRSGPYSLMLLAAVVLLLSVSPAGILLIVEVLGLGPIDASQADHLGRSLLGLGATFVIASILWLVRINRLDARRRAFATQLAQVAERIGGRVARAPHGLRCWADAGVLGLLQVDLTFGEEEGVRLLLGSPAPLPLLVLRRTPEDHPAPWEPVLRGMEWDMRAPSGERLRRVVRDDGLATALDVLFQGHAARYARHDHSGVEVEVSGVAPGQLVASVEAAFAVASRLARLNI